MQSLRTIPVPAGARANCRWCGAVLALVLPLLAAEAEAAKPKAPRAAAKKSLPPPPTAAPKVEAAPAPEPASAATSESEAERPWATRVPKERQEQALALFRAGNAALKESHFARAAEIYGNALKAWDHPAIHYNLVLALVNLDQPLETRHHLAAALRFGAAPLDAGKHEQALRYMASVEKQLATIVIRCDTEGAEVKLNGAQVLTGPGNYAAVVRAGTHSVVASKAGFLTSQQTQTLPGGTTRRIEVKLVSAENQNQNQNQIHLRRRWPLYQPWILVGAGTVLLATSAGLHVSAREAFRSYDDGISACVRQETGGCVPSISLASTRAGGETRQGVALAGYALGAGALLTGAVLVYFNRLEPFTPSVGVTSPVSVVPLLGSTNGAALVVAF